MLRPVTFLFYYRRGLDRDNDTERQRNKKKERNGKMEAVKVVAFSNDDKHAFRQNEMHANISVP